MTDSFQAALASFQRKNSSHSKTQNRRPDAGNEGENRVSISRAQFSVDDSIGNSYSLRLVNHQMDRLLAGANEVKRWRQQRGRTSIRGKGGEPVLALLFLVMIEDHLIMLSCVTCARTYI
eukprot:279007_1